jgi:hypothetical protein
LQTQIGPYRVDDEIGRVGMGVVKLIVESWSREFEKSKGR